MMRDGTISADLRMVTAFLSLPDKKLAIGLAQRALDRKMTIKGVVLAAARLKEAMEAEPLAGKGTPALRLASRRSRIPFDETNEPPKFNAIVYMGKAPRWELVAQSANATCASCELRSMANASTCGRCPLVVMLTELAREAK